MDGGYDCADGGYDFVWMGADSFVFGRELFGGTNTGINFDKYEDIPVEASGEDPPKHIEKFSDCALSEIIQLNVDVSLHKHTHMTIFGLTA